MAFSASIIFKGVDGVTAPIKRMQASTEMFALTASASFSKVGAFSSGLANKMESLSSKMINFKSILAGGIIVEASRWLVGMAEKAAEAGFQQVKFGERTGMSLQSVKELTFAMKSQGLTAEQGMKYIEKFSIQIGKLKMNTGNLNTFLASNDQALLVKLKRTKSVSSAFDLMAEAVSKVKDPTVRASFASAAFGARAKEITSLLMQGSKGVEKAREEYRKYASDTNTSANAIKEFHHNQLLLNTSLDSLKNSIGIAVIPALSKVMDSMSEWISQNKKMIKENISEYIKDFAGAFLFVIKHLNIIIPLVVAYTSALVFLKVATVACRTFTLLATSATWAFTLATDLASISQNGLMLATLKGTAAMKLATAWIWLTSAATWAWTAALLANPITWVVAAVLALGAALYFTIKYWKDVTDAAERWSNSTNWFIHSVGVGLKGLTDSISGVGTIWDNITKSFNDGGFLAGLNRICAYIIANVIQPIKELLSLISKIPGFGFAGDAAKSLQKYQDSSTGNEKPVNKDASIITQKKILETNSSQNVQINIDDSTGRARVGGNTSAIPVLINNTKSFDWYGRKD